MVPFYDRIDGLCSSIQVPVKFPNLIIGSIIVRVDQETPTLGKAGDMNFGN